MTPFEMAVFILYCLFVGFGLGYLSRRIERQERVIKDGRDTKTSDDRLQEHIRRGEAYLIDNRIIIDTTSDRRYYPQLLEEGGKLG